jgi:GT2 family glycosyltransferase
VEKYASNEGILMKVEIVTIAFVSPENIDHLFASAMHDIDKHDIRFRLFLHSSIPHVRNMCEAMNNIYQTTYYPYGANVGCAHSWNVGLHDAYEDGADVVIVCNDDIIFSPGDIDKIAKKAIANRDRPYISCAGRDIKVGSPVVTLGYSCLAINPITIETVGYMDQNFFPAYLEDCDYHRRVTLAGLVEENVPDTKVTHLGSNSIDRDQKLFFDNLVTQRNNGLYYITKWGGLNGNEVYNKPFNQFGIKIEWEDRHDPYPGYRRDNPALSKLR